MHELSIALSMIDGVLEHAKKQGDVHVEAVHLKLGAFSGVDKDALEFSYGIACEGTPLQGSRLIIEQVPIAIFCPTCSMEHILASPQQMCCPECQTPAYDVRSGRELEITALEIS
jgi:hydrogenase nickel incorporation protein HypA/HybF